MYKKNNLETCYLVDIYTNFNNMFKLTISIIFLLIIDCLKE